MNKCLITKLNAVVNDDNIPNLYDVVFSINPTDATAILFNLRSDNANKRIIKCLEGGTFTVNGVSGLSTYTASNEEDVYIVANTRETKIKFIGDSLYNIRIGNMNNFKISDVLQCPNVQSINLWSNSVTGNIEDLKYLPNLELCILNNTNTNSSFTGNIDSLALPKLGSFQLTNSSNVTGSIEAFTKACLLNSSIEGSQRIRFINTAITLNNTSKDINAYVYYEDDSITIKNFDDKALIATYNVSDDNWTYNE